MPTLRYLPHRVYPLFPVRRCRKGVEVVGVRTAQQISEFAMSRLSAQLEEWKRGAKQNLIFELETLLLRIDNMAARAVILSRIDKLKKFGV